MIVVDDIPSAPFPNRSRSPVVQRLARSVVAGLIVWGGLAEEQPAARPDFQRDIAPILTRRCSECHGPDQQKAGLRLDS
ncbi:MAG: c-type cytochrome domain-containing protein, partial [Limisphaerales bacterium]